MAEPTVRQFRETDRSDVIALWHDCDLRPTPSDNGAETCARTVLTDAAGL